MIDNARGLPFPVQFRSLFFDPHHTAKYLTSSRTAGQTIHGYAFDRGPTIRPPASAIALFDRDSAFLIIPPPNDGSSSHSTTSFSSPFHLSFSSFTPRLWLWLSHIGSVFRFTCRPIRWQWHPLPRRRIQFGHTFLLNEAVLADVKGSSLV